MFLLPQYSLSTLPPSESRGQKKGEPVEAHSFLSLCRVLGAGLGPVRAGGRLSSVCHCPSPLSEEASEVLARDGVEMDNFLEGQIVGTLVDF